HLPVGEPRELFCDTRALGDARENTYEVVAVDIPLFEDPHCSIQRAKFVGLMLRITESGGRPFTRIQPTLSGKYRPGQYVTHVPFLDQTVCETWYVEPATSLTTPAWKSSRVAQPEVIGQTGDRKFVRIQILPADIRLGPDERRTLRVRAIGVDGAVVT